ncbi:hypothetical protein Ancab_021239 [Ancistrocladus abbreviatus]
MSMDAISNCITKPIGVNMVLLSATGDESIETIVSTNHEKLAQWFILVRPWLKHDIGNSRITWLKNVLAMVVAQPDCGLRISTSLKVPPSINPSNSYVAEFEHSDHNRKFKEAVVMVLALVKAKEMAQKGQNPRDSDLKVGINEGLENQSILEWFSDKVVDS